MEMCGGHGSRLPDLPSWHAAFFTACEKGLFSAGFNLGKFLRSRGKCATTPREVFIISCSFSGARKSADVFFRVVTITLP